jgi:hypothetical protein
MGSFHLSVADDALTVETARRALFLWLHARQTGKPLTVPPAAEGRYPQWREEMDWLELGGDGEAEAPDWLKQLSPVEEAEPSPWGEWGGRTAVAELRELGVLPEAMVNFLALLGWPRTQAHQEAGKETASLAGAGMRGWQPALDAEESDGAERPRPLGRAGAPLLPAHRLDAG